MPAQDCVRRHDSRHLAQDSSAKGLTLRGEPSALVVGESDALAAELLLEDAVLFNEVVDGLSLLAVEPACARGDEELKREGIGHGALYRPAGSGAVSRGWVTYG